MKVYWCTIIIMYILCYLARESGSARWDQRSHSWSYRPNGTIAFLAGAILICVAGLRKGFADTVSYMAGFNNITGTWSENVNELLANDSKDAGFYFFTRFFHFFISDNAQVYIFVLSLITLGLIFYVLYKYSDLFEMAIFLFITSGCFVVTMNGVRQYLASAIMFFAFPLIEKRKWYIYIPLVLIVSTIHTTALIFIPLYFIVGEKAWGRITWLILGVGAFLYVSYPVTGPMLASVLNESQYSEYSGVIASTGAGANIIRVAVMAVPVVLSYWGRRLPLRKKKYYNTMLNMSVVNLVMILLATRYWIYARFNVYFMVYMIILLCWLIKDMFDESTTKLVQLGCIVCYLIYFYYETVISYGWTYDMPFFFWQ